MMRYEHTNRPGFWLGFIDFFTAGLFFLIYMPMGLQDELETILVHKIHPYWQAYLLGIPVLFIYPLVWMAGIAEELKAKAIELDIEGPHTSRKHMFWWNILGCLCFGPGMKWKCPKCGREFSKRNQDHYCVRPQNIEEYIAAQDTHVQPRLKEVRDILAAALPADLIARIARWCYEEYGR